MSFLSNNIMRGTDWRALERAVARLMILAGWKNVSVVGASGDNGADIIGVRYENGVPKNGLFKLRRFCKENMLGLVP